MEDMEASADMIADPQHAIRTELAFLMQGMVIGKAFEARRLREVAEGNLPDIGAITSDFLPTQH